MSDNLDDEKADLYRILTAITPAEVQHMLDSVEAGQIQGNTYRHDLPPNSCGCLAGSIYQYRKLECLEDLPFKVKALADGIYPIEDYVVMVDVGDTPATSEPLANVSRWLREWIAAQAEKAVSG